jgi:FkbM family methyltransferase
MGGRVITINGLAWPDDVGGKWQHALGHLQSLNVSIARCRAAGRMGTAVQAGGNVGLWPRAMAEVFSRVITFEPDAISRECLLWNVPKSVEVRSEALGDVSGWCGISHKSLGSHKVTEGSSVRMMPLDELGLAPLDLLQLDIEGYEGPALRGAEATIARCRPILHIELRDLNQAAGCRTADVVAWLRARGYHQVATAPGCDVVFEARA